MLLLPHLLVTLLALISWQIAAQGPLLRVDAALRAASTRWVPPGGPGSAAAQFCADLGGPVLANTLLVAGAAALARWRRSTVPLFLAPVAALSVPALVLPLKEAFGRPGPDGLPLGGYAGYYPSGHAVTAAVAYGTLALLCARPGAHAVAVVLNLCTGAGLVLRGYHWATDVVAGWALAGLVLWAVHRVAARLVRPDARAPQSRPGRPPGLPSGRRLRTRTSRTTGRFADRAAPPPRASPVPAPPGR